MLSFMNELVKAENTCFNFLSAREREHTRWVLGSVNFPASEILWFLRSHLQICISDQFILFL